MIEHGFSPALEEPEVIVLTKERLTKVPPFGVGEIMVLSKSSVKHLDTKMNFF